jgi:hypothetical protein
VYQPLMEKGRSFPSSRVLLPRNTFLRMTAR